MLIDFHPIVVTRSLPLDCWSICNRVAARSISIATRLLPLDWRFCLGFLFDICKMLSKCFHGRSQGGLLPLRVKFRHHMSVSIASNWLLIDCHSSAGRLPLDSWSIVFSKWNDATVIHQAVLISEIMILTKFCPNSLSRNEMLPRSVTGQDQIWLPLDFCHSIGDFVSGFYLTFFKMLSKCFDGRSQVGLLPLDWCHLIDATRLFIGCFHSIAATRLLIDYHSIVATRLLPLDCGSIANRVLIDCLFEVAWNSIAATRLLIGCCQSIVAIRVLTDYHSMAEIWLLPIEFWSIVATRWTILFEVSRSHVQHAVEMFSRPDTRWIVAIWLLKPDTAIWLMQLDCGLVVATRLLPLDCCHLIADRLPFEC